MLLDLILIQFCIASTKASFRTSKDGVLSTESKAAYIDTQWGGHFTLGSNTKRYPVERVQFAKLDLPSINADCSGIDIYNGGFSFIQTEQIVRILKSIGSSAGAFAFNLALETVSPQIASTIKWAQDIAQKVNLANIGSCEGAAALMGAIMPRNTKLHENACKLMATHGGKTTDFVSGRVGCKKGGDNRTSTQEELETSHHAMGEATNIAWYVINKNTAWAGDTGEKKHQRKETLMSITGTVITGGPEGFKILSPLALDEDFFNAFAEGGQAKMYRCDPADTKCLAPTEVTRQILFHETHTNKVSQLLLAIEEKIYSDTALDDEEKELIVSTQVPILRIINIMSAYQRGKAPISIHAYAEIIAQDLLTQHIKQMISTIRQIASDFSHLQINAEPLKAYMKELSMIDRKLYMRQQETNHKVEQILQIIQKTQVLEKELYGNMRVLAAGG